MIHWRPYPQSLRAQIIIFFGVLFIAVQGVALLLVDAANTRNARDQSKQELAVGERVFRDLLNRNNAELTQAAELLARDFAFREAVATHDLPTLASVLANHGSRIHADLAQLVSPEGQFIADSMRVHGTDAQFPFSWLMQEAEERGNATGLVILEGRAYQLVLVPVLAPTPIAWAVFGVSIDDRTARELQKLSELDVSFLTRGTDSRWSVLASTIPLSQQQELVEEFSSHSDATTQGSAMILGGTEYETLIRHLDHAGEAPILAVQQRSLDDALKPFKPLHRILIVLALISVAASVVGSILIGRSITRPLLALGQMTERIEEGGYSQPVAISGADEIVQLARRFNVMRDGIATREREILRLAYGDTLTGLPNRARFREQLETAIRSAQDSTTPVTVLVVNLDRFSYINETLGHAAGDEVLKHVAARLTALLSGGDIVARLGGDEFAVLLVGVGTDQGVRAAAKVADALESPIVVGPQSLDVRASIGIAGYPAHGIDAETLLRHADAAMSLAKHSKQGVLTYDPRLRQRREEQLSLLSELRHAMEANELRLAYQPKVDLATGAVTEVEALMRWWHPTKGPISPGMFIPFAEQTGFIKTVTAWAIAHAAAQCAHWRLQGLSLCVSINISAQDLLNPALTSIVADAVTRYGLPPRQLCLEITESGVMQDPARAIEVLAALQASGVGLSIDDFGTGYSSLSYVKHLAVNELKIDRSFITNLATDEKDRAIVLSTIELAHHLGLKVVAEGVENQETLDVLKELGCDSVQGFLFTRALDPGALVVWINERRVRPALTAF